MLSFLRKISKESSSISMNDAPTVQGDWESIASWFLSITNVMCFLKLRDQIKRIDVIRININDRAHPAEVIIRSNQMLKTVNWYAFNDALSKIHIKPQLPTTLKILFVFGSQLR